MDKDGKINILVIPSDRFGVGFWRSVSPHRALALSYPDKFTVDIIYDIPTNGILEEFYKKYDIVHIHKKLDDNCEIIHFFQKIGCLVIIDVDDAPKLDREHPMYLTSEKEKWYIPINKSMAEANAVTTTTKIFANEIKNRWNKNAFVLPNALPEGEGQFVLHKEHSDRIRFGVVCGSSHLYDLLILKDMVQMLPKEYLDKIQFVLCGFDTNGTKTIYQPGQTEPIRRPIEPQESVWNDFERILTNNYNTISEEHKKFLQTYTKIDDPFKNEPYARYWTIPIHNYYQQYNHVDVLLAPLVESHFNSVKSELKFVEAGFAKIPIVAQDFGPYSPTTIGCTPILEKNGIVNKNGNCFLIETAKNKKGWLKAVKWIIDNPDCLQWAGENLYKFTKENYSLENVTKKRAQIYTELIENKEKYIK